jgi:uncharacterized protein YdhG (YjbR/CyaY superfamily)
MNSANKHPENVDDYIAGFPPDVRQRLEAVRTAVRKAAPDAEERLSYQMPAFFLNGVLVYFAAFKKHIGFYPRNTALRKFRKELSPYMGAKCTVRFPFDKPIPTRLISKIVKFRVTENSKDKKP